MISLEEAARFLRIDEADETFPLCYKAAQAYIKGAAGFDPAAIDDDEEADMLLVRIASDFHEKRSYLQEGQYQPDWISFSILTHLQEKYDTSLETE